jgi:hypothetical protein
MLGANITKNAMQLSARAHAHTHTTMRYSHLVYLQKAKVITNFREAQNLNWRTYISAPRGTG